MKYSKLNLRKFIPLIGFLGIFLLGGGTTFSQNFVYQPTNPAFGGNYLNYQWLLSSAQVQNTHEAKTADRVTRDPLKDFEENLNRQILSQLSRNLMRNYFSEGFSEGNYNVGSYEIEITPGLNGLEIEILDTATGDKTTVTVPYF